MATGHGVSTTRAGALAMVLAFVLAGALALTPSLAAAQSLPPICQQYPDLPQCQPDVLPPTSPDPEDEADDEDEGEQQAGVPPAGGPSATSPVSGELPFTGYPLTSLVLVLGILLLAGLSLRAYLALRGRVSARNPVAP